MITYPLTAAGITTRVLDDGPRDGRPILFVHGLGARADRWRANVEAMGASGQRAYAIDLPGHGFADKPADFTYTTPGYVDWLAAVLDVLGIEQLVLVGTSLGGHVAATFTTSQPARVAGLGLVAPVGLLEWPIDRRVATAARAADVSLAGVENKLRVLLHDESLVTAELIEEEWRMNNSAGGPEAMAQLGRYVLDGVEDDRVLDALAALASPMPMLLVWGEHDQSAPIEALQAIAERLPHARVLRVADAGHAPQVEQAALVNEALAGLVEAAW